MKKTSSPHLLLVTSEDIENERRWIEKEIESIGAQTLKKLAKAAAQVRKNAYPPYSKYYVGAAVLTHAKHMYASCNAERVSFSETDHAEQSTITKAISEGEYKKYGRKFLRAVATAGPNRETAAAPCGRCRQTIAEHCDNCLIIEADKNGKIVYITSLRVILPFEFSPSVLGIS